MSLGAYKLLKTEDTGTVHPAGQFVAPDFRLVLKDGTQWLIDVKNVFSDDPDKQRLVLRKIDIEKLTAYADATGCPLKIAIYWARWRMWSLVDVSDLTSISDKKLAIDMISSLPLNQLGSVGDRTIGTKPPLIIRVIFDKTKARSIASSGELSYTIADAKMFCAGKEIANSVERDLAFIFIQYGDWNIGEPKPILDSEDLPEAIEFELAPRERNNPDEDFEMIGTLSSMFSRYYGEVTIGPNGILQTEADHIPNWFAPLLNADYKSDALPLWRFALERAGKR